jgi:hypothetical protein
MPKKIPIGVFANLSTPSQRRENSLAMFKRMTGKTVVSVKSVAEPQELCAWYVPRVSTEMR